jgi:hypothetical protein
VKKSSKFSSDELLGMLKALSEAPEKADNVKKLYDEIVGGGSSSDEMSKKTKPYSNTTTWERDDSDNGYSGTNYPASKQERLSGDTLGGKNEPKHSWTSPSGKKVISNTHPTSIKQIK